MGGEYERRVPCACGSLAPTLLGLAPLTTGLAACSGAGNVPADAIVDADATVDADPADARSLTFLEYREELAQAICDYFIACETRRPGSQFAAGVFCLDASDNAPEFDEDLARTLGSRERGSVVFDPAEAARCLEEIRRSTTCVLPTTCRAVRPTLPAGAMCSVTTECIGSFCGGDACPTRCVPISGLGEPCLDSPCEDGLLCSFTAGVCLAQKPEGAPCEVDPACRHGLVCFETLCGPRRGPGTSCEQSSQCDDRMVCLDGACSEGLAVGERCVPSQCASGLVCSADARRARLPGPGEACGELSQCLDVYECVGGVCVALPGLGEPCLESTRCSKGVRVDGRCELVDDGTSCDASFPPLGTCVGLCELSACSPAPGDGDPCVSWCPAGLEYRVGTDGRRRCLAACDG